MNLYEKGYVVFVNNKEHTKKCGHIYSTRSLIPGTTVHYTENGHVMEAVVIQPGKDNAVLRVGNLLKLADAADIAIY